MVTHVVPTPERYRAGRLGKELTLTIGWGAVARIDLEPATCGDPECDADHGFTGTLTGDDLVPADQRGRGGQGCPRRGAELRPRAVGGHRSHRSHQPLMAVRDPARCAPAVAALDLAAAAPSSFSTCSAA